MLNQVVGKYKIFNSNDEYEYDVVITENENGDLKFELIAANNSAWTELVRGKVLLTLIDDGNGLHIKFRDADYSTEEVSEEELYEKGQFWIDYAEEEYVRILLSVKYKHKYNDFNQAVKDNITFYMLDVNEQINLS